MSGKFTQFPCTKEWERNNLTWERGRLARIVTAGGTPALLDIAKWVSYLKPIPKSPQPSDIHFCIAIANLQIFVLSVQQIQFFDLQTTL